MAASTVTRNRGRIDGKSYIHLTIVETASETGTETVLEKLPKFGTIVKFQSAFISGAASTVNPELGRAAGWTDNKADQVIVAPGAATFVDNNNRIPYFSTDGKLYLRSQPNTGTNNVIHTVLLIVGSWE